MSNVPREGNRFVVAGAKHGRGYTPDRVYTVTRVDNPWTIRCSVTPPLSGNRPTTVVEAAFLTRANKLKSDD